MKLVIEHVSGLQEAAIKLLKFAKKKKIYFFTGDIGAGKTTFIQSICKAIGTADKVTSPTFSIVNEYSFAKKDKTEGVIYHIDLYRLKDTEEAIHIGIEDYLDRGDYVFIEWPQPIEFLDYPDVVKINIEIIENSKRNIIFLYDTLTAK